MDQRTSILSYNLRFHQAYTEAFELAAHHDASIICLQECDPAELLPRVGNFVLGAATSVGKWGLAIYYDPDRMKVARTASRELPKSLYERLSFRRRERMVTAEFYDLITQKTVLVASFHATHLVATNYLRRRQLSQGMNTLNELAPEAAAVLVGDYNYPFFHSKLERFTSKYNYQLVMTDAHTFKNEYFKGSFDFAAIARTRLAAAKTLPFGTSDHAPILVEVEHGITPRCSDHP